MPQTLTKALQYIVAGTNATKTLQNFTNEAFV